jgi:hypothetical protein
MSARTVVVSRFIAAAAIGTSGAAAPATGMLHSRAANDTKHRHRRMPILMTINTPRATPHGRVGPNLY